MDLGPLLRAHAFLRVERPPELWLVEADDVALVRLLGELIAATLARGNALRDTVLNVSNVSVEHDADEPASAPAPGEYVAISVRGKGDCGTPMRWTPRSPPRPALVSDDLQTAARVAGVPFAYTQSVGGEGSITVFFPRLRPVRAV